MLVKILQWLGNSVVLGLVIGWVANWTGQSVWNAGARGLSNLKTSWRELRLTALAKRVNRLEAMRKTPAFAVADILMAIFVAIIGGGYATLVILISIYSRQGRPEVAIDFASFAAGLLIVFAAGYRAVEAYTELVQTEKIIARLRARALRSDWDLEDACAALRS